jgi:hypothetical protein
VAEDDCNLEKNNNLVAEEDDNHEKITTLWLRKMVTLVTLKK